MLNLHLDTDIGGDIDDLCALAMVLNWPDAELLAVTTVAEHQGKRAGYAHYVIEHSSPTFVPLAVTVETSLKRAYLATLRQSGPLARLIARQAEAFAREENYEAQYGQTCKGLPDDTINFQHDPLTCAIALGWNEGVEISEIPLKLEIKDGWLCQRVDDSGKPTRVVTRVNGDKFNEFWFSTVVRQK